MRTPAEIVIRLIVLKHVRGWSYETLEREVRANMVYRVFTRMGAEKVPDAKTMVRLGQALGPETRVEGPQDLTNIRDPHLLQSKHQFQRQLDDAIIAPQQSAVSADVVGDLPKVRSSQSHVTASVVRHETWNGQIHMVGKVEGFRTQLNRLVFPDPKVSR